MNIMLLWIQWTQQKSHSKNGEQDSWIYIYVKNSVDNILFFPVFFCVWITAK